MESPLAHQRIDQAPRYQATDAVSVLRRGGVVAVPTDTLYGLAVSALDVAAVERLFRIKGRPESRAMPLLLADAADIDRYAAEVPQVAWALAEAFFPGALTLVLRRGDVVPEAVTGGLDTVAVRVPDHPVPRTIVRELGAPITGTSANRTGSSALTTAEAVREQLGPEVDLVIDEGPRPSGQASTVLDVAGASPRLVREGAVRREEIERVCGEVLGDSSEG